MIKGGDGAKTTARLATAFVIGFVMLTLEIAYTRVISFKLFYYYTYFVIGLALLGLGAASAVTALSGRLRNLDTLRVARVVGPAAAAVGVVGYVVAARLPTDVNLIWAGTLGEATRQVATLFVLSVALTAVFFAVGLIMASLIRRRGAQRPAALLLGSPRCRVGLPRRRPPAGHDRAAGDDPRCARRARPAGAARRTGNTRR